MKEAERFISSRLRFKGKLCIVAISVSFFIIILAQSISCGYRKEILDALRAIGGDIVLAPADGGKVKIDSSLISNILKIDGIEKVEPAIYQGGIVRKGKETVGVVFKGKGDHQENLQAIVPSGLSERLNLEEEKSFTAYFLGNRLKARNFTVSSIIENPLESEDKTIVQTGIQDMRRICSMNSDEATVLEVILKDRISGREAVKMAAIEIGELCFESARENEAPLCPTTVYENYSRLFDWLDLIDVNVIAILILMTIVAGFNMISGLLIVLFRSVSTIGTLKALGMTDKGIAGVFLRMSSRFVLKGMAIGNILAVVLCLIQNGTHFLKLDAANYFLSFVPTRINLSAIVVCDLAAYLGIMLLLLIPSLFISRVDPAESVKIS